MSPYMFLFVAEFLTLMIENHKDIKGMKIGKYSFKIVQFADDTTIILDGTQHSLQATLNILEIYGSMSGLKVNTEKTKTIWFGSKRGSKDKLAISSDLVWDDSEFTLLGLEFSVNLPSIPIKNYSKAISSINKTIESWKYRKTTPIRKITIIKSLLLSKLVHLFMLLPITDKILKEINSILYKFLWGGKADKVNRQDVCKPYIKGGLQMTDIFLFEKRMKLKWLQLIMNSNSKGWFKLLDKCLGNVNNIFIFGTEWCIKTKHCLNPFWESVFRYWTDIEKSHQFESNDDIWSNCL